MLISVAHANPLLGGSGSSFASMLPLVFLIVIMYFLMIRPQIKKQKELKKMIESLAVNDEVVTTGGLVGKIVANSDSTYFTIELTKGVEVKVLKNSIVQVLPKLG